MENRHDQSALSVLAKKHGIIPYRDPSQWGGYQKIPYRHKCMGYNRDYTTYERSKYPTMFIQHRYKKITLKNILSHMKSVFLMYLKLWKNPAARI